MAPLPPAWVFHPRPRHPQRLVNCLKQRNPVKLVAAGTSTGLLLRPSQPKCPTIHPGVSGFGQQCVAGRPRCLLGTRLSSCSSTRARDFSVGSTGYANSMGATSPRPNIDNSLSHFDVGCFSLQPTMIVPSRPRAQASCCRDMEVHTLHGVPRSNRSSHNDAQPRAQESERCLSVICPTTDHIPSGFSTSQAGASDLNA